MPPFPLSKACFFLLLLGVLSCHQRQVSVPVPPAPPPVPASVPAPARAPAPAPAPAPKLGDVLTSGEQKQLSASIDQSLSRAQASLNRLSGRQLNKDQQSEVDQIQSFMKQARATRNSDPSGAKSLAERAEVLARDLAANVH